jgi:hypothetical protein
MSDIEDLKRKLANFLLENNLILIAETEKFIGHGAKLSLQSREDKAIILLEEDDRGPAKYTGDDNRKG